MAHQALLLAALGGPISLLHVEQVRCAAPVWVMETCKGEVSLLYLPVAVQRP